MPLIVRKLCNIHREERLGDDLSFLREKKLDGQDGFSRQVNYMKPE